MPKFNQMVHYLSINEKMNNGIYSGMKIKNDAAKLFWLHRFLLWKKK